MKARIYKKYFYTLCNHILDEYHKGNIKQAQKCAWKLGDMYVPARVDTWYYAVNLVSDLKKRDTDQEDIQNDAQMVELDLIDIWRHLNIWHHKKIYGIFTDK